MNEGGSFESLTLSFLTGSSEPSISRTAPTLSQGTVAPGTSSNPSNIASADETPSIKNALPIPEQIAAMVWSARHRQGDTCPWTFPEPGTYPWRYILWYMQWQRQRETQNGLEDTQEEMAMELEELRGESQRELERELQGGVADGNIFLAQRELLEQAMSAQKAARARQ